LQPVSFGKVQPSTFSPTFSAPPQLAGFHRLEQRAEVALAEGLALLALDEKGRRKVEECSAFRRVNPLRARLPFGGLARR
jgi:hypothetical protein